MLGGQERGLVEHPPTELRSMAERASEGRSERRNTMSETNFINAEHVGQ